MSRTQLPMATVSFNFGRADVIVTGDIFNTAQFQIHRS
jgi:hypothetical protein